MSSMRTAVIKGMSAFPVQRRGQLIDCFELVLPAGPYPSILRDTAFVATVHRKDHSRVVVSASVRYDADRVRLADPLPDGFSLEYEGTALKLL